LQRLTNKKNKQMKKVFTLVAIASMSTLVSCGPSAEEKAAKEKATQDSIAAVEAAKAAEEAAKAQAIADSTAAYTAAEEAKAKAKQDSIDAAAASKKGTSKPKPAPSKEEQKKEEVKKVTGGKG
jgi:hypothetical protein